MMCVTKARVNTRTALYEAFVVSNASVILTKPR